MVVHVPPLLGATFTVSNTNDDGSAGCLRAAILSASTGDKINFGVTGTITLTNGQLLITNGLSINGPGATNLSISGNHAQRVFAIGSNAIVSISGLTLSNGQGGNDTNYNGLPGGCIYNGGTLGLADCNIVSNRAGSGESVFTAANGGSGGGIYNAGTLSLTNCTVAGNSSGNGSYPFVSGASGGYGGAGGGICNAGDLSLANSTISNNSAGSGGDGYGSSYAGSIPGPGGAGGAGGGIYNSNILLGMACTFSANSAGTGGYGGEADPGYAQVGGLGGNGGGVCNSGTLMLTNCTLGGNGSGTGGNGGFAYVGGGGTGGSGGGGGAIFNSGDLIMIACTLSANSCGSGGPGGDESGVTLYNTGSGGNGGSGGIGGGIFNAATASSAQLVNTLIAANSYGFAGAGGSGAVTQGAPGSSGEAPDLYGSFGSLGYNLIREMNGATGFTNGINFDLVGTTNAPLEPVLGPLRENGGSTPTRALLHGSPAIDAGADALLNPPYNLTTDQRGYPRFAGAHVDIGAFELQRAASPPALVNMSSSGTNGFKFSFSNNTPGATFSVLSSTNVSLPLGYWTVLGQAMQTVPGQFQFTDTQTTNDPQRYYRVGSP